MGYFKWARSAVRIGVTNDGLWRKCGEIIGSIFRLVWSVVDYLTHWVRRWVGRLKISTVCVAVVENAAAVACAVKPSLNL